MDKEDMQVVSIKLPTETHDRFISYCDEKNRSKSEAGRHIIQTALDQAESRFSSNTPALGFSFIATASMLILLGMVAVGADIGITLAWILLLLTLLCNVLTFGFLSAREYERPNP